MNRSIYRVENAVTWQGLWYTGDGVYNPHIKILTEGLCRDLPMGFNPIFKTLGQNWFSACDNLEDMKNWFSHLDLVELKSQGYELYKLDVTSALDVPNHVAFVRESVVKSEIISMREIDDNWI